MSLRTLAVLIAATVTLYAVARNRRDFVDFEVYRTAAVRAYAGEELYRSDDGHYQFKYWPVFALAMGPFALMPAEVAKAAWFVLSVALLVLFVQRSIALVPDRRRPVRALTWIVGLLIAKFVVKELVNGQTNVLLGVLVLAAMVAAQRRRPIAAGAFVGAAVFVKPYALLFVPWLALAVGVSSAAMAVAVVAGGLLAPALVYGWTGNLNQIAAWYRTVTETTAPNLLFPENISFASMWAKWLGPTTMASALTVATSAAALGATVWVYARRQVVARPELLEVAVLLSLVPLLSPQGWDYVVILATPALALLVDRWRDLTTPWRVMLGASIALTSFTIFDLLGRGLYAVVTSSSIQTIAVAGLVAALACLRWRKVA